MSSGGVIPPANAGGVIPPAAGAASMVPLPGGTKPPVAPAASVPPIAAARLPGLAPGLPGLPPAIVPGLPGLPMLPPGLPGGLRPGLPPMVPLAPALLGGVRPTFPAMRVPGMLPLPPGVAGIGGAAPVMAPLVPAVPTDPALVEKNKKLLDELLPLISKKIDSNGGVMKVTDLAPDPQIVKILGQIPTGFPKILQKILLQWTDFFVNMPDGLVGTAMGYETGMIREDGTLDPAYASMFRSGGMLPDAATGDANEHIPEGNEKVELHATADNLWNASVNLKDDNNFVTNFHKILRIRSMLKKGPVSSFGSAPGNVVPSKPGAFAPMPSLIGNTAKAGAPAPKLSRVSDTIKEEPKEQEKPPMAKIKQENELSAEDAIAEMMKNIAGGEAAFIPPAEEPVSKKLELKKRRIGN